MVKGASLSQLLAAAQRRKKITLSLLLVVIVSLASVTHYHYPLTGNRIPGHVAYVESLDSEGEMVLKEDDGVTKLIDGVDGFYVFENVYVKDRTLFMVQCPDSPPLPALNKIITSTLSPTSPIPFLTRLRTTSTSSAAYRPSSSSYDPQLAGSNQDNDDFPQVPRLWVLSVEEARTVIPSFMPRGAKAAGWAGSWWSGEGDIGKRGMGAFRKLWGGGGEGAGQEIEVLGGTTFFWGDDPAIMGWGALMHHYFHFVGELLLGTYHAYISSLSLHNTPAHESWDERRRKENFRPGMEDPPARVVIPWSTNWKGLELQELIMKGAFGDADIIDRNTWRDLNSDHHWRKFSKLIITDRQAAHNDPNSQVSAWNKMALDSLVSPLPTYDPPSNFMSLPQKLLGDSLGLPERPEHRPGTESGWSKGKSLEEGVIRVLYVDRQGSDRKLDDASNEIMMAVLDDVEKRTFGKKKSKVVVTRAKFEDMKVEEQIAAAWEADVILGIHGNGLTHLVWVKSGATLIELFPTGTFIRDYEVLSAALNHNYMTVWHDEIFTKDRWLDEKSDPQAGRLHDGTAITVDKKFITKILNEAMLKMAH